MKNTLILHQCMRIPGSTHYMALLRSALRLLVLHIQVPVPFEVSDVAGFTAMV